MSVICWDGSVMAADKRSVSGFTVSTVQKIFAINGFLVGFVGDHSCTAELKVWFENGAIPELYPKSNLDPDKCAHMLVITPHGRPILYLNGPYPTGELHDRKTALGCGGESAMVAMHCGKTAPEAVEVVCLFNNGCGNGISQLSMDDAERSRPVRWQQGWYPRIDIPMREYLQANSFKR